MKPLFRLRFTATGMLSVLAIINTSLAWAQPTASNPMPLLVQCIADVPPPDVLVVTDEADVMAVPVVTWESDLSDGNSCPETITRSYKVTGDNGIYIYVYQSITIHDLTDPVFAPAPANLAIECTADIPAMTSLSWTDNCDGAGAVAGTDVSNGNTCPETITRTWNYTDACGNAVSATQTILIDDTTPPTASVPSTIFLPSGSMAPAPDVLVVTDEADNCTANPTVVWVSDVSDGLDPETITRTYCVIDECNLMFCVEQLIIIGMAGIESAVLNNKLNIFPNPSEGMLTISFGKEVEHLDLFMHDLNGKVLSSNSYESANELSVNLPQTAGIYLLTLQVNDSEVRTFRVLRR